jgi:hypothetical protein
VNGAKRENALDLVEKARISGAFDTVAICTNSPEMQLKGQGISDIVVTTPTEGFHFGHELALLSSAMEHDRICYFGSGAGALMGPDEIAALAEGGEGCDVVANNLFSTDFCAFTNDISDAGDALPATDNSLAKVLVERCGFRGRELPRTFRTLFDMDAPLDLCALKYSGTAGGRLGRYVDAHAPDAPHLLKAMSAFTDRNAEVLIAGRVSADTHMFLDRRTACRVRLMVEERGLAASGEGVRARSIVGMWLDAAGPRKAFESMAGRTHAAIIDSRLLMACKGMDAGPEERFALDLLMKDRVRAGYMKGLCAAAAAAPFPVVLANHSLLNGGLMLLVEAAWIRLGMETGGVKGLRSINETCITHRFQEEPRNGTKVSG